jgi:pilus assembly protein CpaB
MNRRVVPIVIAVGLAVLAGIVVFLFARSTQSSSATGDQPVTVLVTTQQIAQGTTLQAAMDAGALNQTQVPIRLRPAGAVEAVTAQNGSLLAVGDLQVNQMVLDGDFASVLPAVASSALEVPEGLVAISVPLADPNKVGPFLRPGSEIGVFDTIALTGAAAAAPAAEGAADGAGEPGTGTGTGGAGSGTTTRLLIDKAMVLAIGPVNAEAASAATAEAWNAPLVTVAVTQAQAEKLIQALQSGTPYMALLGPNTSLKQSAGVSDADLFN